MRIVILSADIGEGHVAVARALAERLDDVGDVEVIHRDGLACFGLPARIVIRDAYRLQLRWAPWSYSAMYWLFTHAAAVRRLGATALELAARRRLRRMLRRLEPDMVVSTYPALTAVLGSMRLRRELRVPLCAVVTDLADFAAWAHRGADSHLVMHAHAVAEVQRVAGAGSVTLVSPLVSPKFLIPMDPREARRALGLPCSGRLVAVSGGGWGVGDLAGAVQTALCLDDVTVVALAGRNEHIRRALAHEFQRDRRVHVLGFTERMDEVLKAADVLVHSTGGMTSMEAMACGCPLIAYGSSAGHIEVHNRTMERLGLITVADDHEQLVEALQTQLDGSADGATDRGGGADPASAVMQMTSRVLPLPRWRLAASRAMAWVTCAAAVTAFASTDDAYSLVARPLELRPVSHVSTQRPEVALVIRARGATVPALARSLRARGGGASFAAVRPPAPRVARALATAGDDCVRELTRAGRFRWPVTRGRLHGLGRLGDDRRYLVPAQGLTLGEYVMARTDDASPIDGRVHLTADKPSALPKLSPGDIVVVDAGTSGARMELLMTRLLAQLAAAGLRPVSLPQLLGAASTKERTVGEAHSAAAPAITSASEQAVPKEPAAP